MPVDGRGELTVFTPPPVEALTDQERRRLRATLADVVDAWSGAVEISMRVSDLHEDSECVGGTGDVWFRMGASPVALRLTPLAAASLLCVNLGGEIAVEADTNLSEIDRALLEAWARRALPELATALGVGAASEVLRGAPVRCDGANERRMMVAAELTFADEQPAGAIVIGVDVARMPGDGPTATLSDHADLLLEASVMVEATISADPVPLPDVLTLDRGDVLLLGNKATVEAQLSAGETVVATGRPGAREEMRALRVKGSR